MKDVADIYHLVSENQNQSIKLYNVFEAMIFKDIDMTLIKELIPLWIVDAGISPESRLDKISFEKLVRANNNEITHRILYCYDCQTLVATLQDRLDSTRDLVEHFYKHISCDSKFESEDYERGVRHMGQQATVCFTFLNSIFITLGSLFDIITKIAIELEEISEERIDFAQYPKLRSNGKLYGQKHLVNSKLIKDTLFEDLPIIRQAISIRDEIVHNGTWDYRPAIYGGYKAEEYEEWIMMPDFDASGTFVSFKNRKRFYSRGDKMNVEIISFLIDILKLMYKTQSAINSLYLIGNQNKLYDITTFSEEIKNWTLSFIQLSTKDEYKA